MLPVASVRRNAQEWDEPCYSGADRQAETDFETAAFLTRLDYDSVASSVRFVLPAAWSMSS